MGDEACAKQRNTDDAVITYRFVRVGLVALVSMLLVSTAITAVQKKCVLGSLSAYYYTTTHAVFIAALCAAGSCLIIYKGRSPDENQLLDFSGVLAFVVAFVPTSGGIECGVDLPTQDGPFVGVGNNVPALMATLLVGIVTYRVIATWRKRLSAEPGIDRFQAQDVPGWLLRVLKLLAMILRWAVRYRFLFLAVILVAGVVLFVRQRTWFEGHAHGIAAVLMFGGMVGVAIIHAGYASSERRRARRFFVVAYISIAGWMAGTVAASVVFAFFLHVNRAILVSELLAIIGFAAFWIVQTLDVWDVRECTYTKKSLDDLTDATSG